MSGRRNMAGLLVAAVGGGGLALDLFNTWYTLRVPDSLLDRATQASSQFGPFGDLIRAGAAALAHTTFQISGWDGLSRIHWVLLALGLGAMWVSLKAYTGRLDGDGQILIGLGVLASVLVLYRAAAPPGPIVDGHMLLHTTTGAWLALLATAMIVGGGVIESRSVAGASRSAGGSSGSGQPSWLAPAPVGAAPGAPAGVGFGAAIAPPPAAAAGQAPGALPGDGHASSQSTGWTPPEFFS